MLTREAMIHALRQQGRAKPVIDVMTREIPIVRPRQSLEEALRLLQEGDVPGVGVLGDDGRLCGYITTENIGEIMMVNAAQPRRVMGITARPPINPWG